MLLLHDLGLLLLRVQVLQAVGVGPGAGGMPAPIMPADWLGPDTPMWFARCGMPPGWAPGWLGLCAMPGAMPGCPWGDAGMGRERRSHARHHSVRADDPPAWMPTAVSRTIAYDGRCGVCLSFPRSLSLSCCDQRASARCGWRATARGRWESNNRRSGPAAAGRDDGRRLAAGAVGDAARAGSKWRRGDFQGGRAVRREDADMERRRRRQARLLLRQKRPSACCAALATAEKAESETESETECDSEIERVVCWLRVLANVWPISNGRRLRRSAAVVAVLSVELSRTKSRVAPGRRRGGKLAADTRGGECCGRWGVDEEPWPIRQRKSQPEPGGTIILGGGGERGRVRRPAPPAEFCCSRGEGDGREGWLGCRSRIQR